MLNTWRSNFILLSTKFSLFLFLFLWLLQPEHRAVQRHWTLYTIQYLLQYSMSLVPGWSGDVPWLRADTGVTSSPRSGVGVSSRPPMFLLLRAWPLRPLRPPGPANMLAQLPVLRVSRQPEPEPKGSSLTNSTDLMLRETFSKAFNFEQDTVFES